MSIASHLRDDALQISLKCVMVTRQFQDNHKMSWRCLVPAGSVAPDNFSKKADKHRMQGSGKFKSWL